MLHLQPGVQPSLTLYVELGVEGRDVARDNLNTRRNSSKRNREQLLFLLLPDAPVDLPLPVRAVRMAATPAPPPTEPTAETSAASSFSLLPVELALLSSLSVTEKLLVAQATYELGSQDFKGVAKLLQGHALLKERGRSFFSADVSRLEAWRRVKLTRCCRDAPRCTRR